jgi:hypothetical protein
MMRVWSHRPRLSHMMLFFGAYVTGDGFATSAGFAETLNHSLQQLGDAVPAQMWRVTPRGGAIVIFTSPTDMRSG